MRKIIFYSMVFFFISLIYIINRWDFIGFDGYFNLTLICQEDHIYKQILLSEPNLFFKQTILQHLPCNIPVLKAIHGILASISAIFIVLWARETKLVRKEHIKYFSLLLLFSPVFILEHLKFENEPWAYPLIFGSLFFITKFSNLDYVTWKAHKLISILIGVSMLYLAVLIWKGSAIFLLIIHFFAPILLVLTLPLIVWNSNSIIISIFQSGGLVETFPFVGLWSLAGYWMFALPGFFLNLHKKINRIIIPGLFFLLISAFNSIFVILAIPFLLIGLYLFILAIKPSKLIVVILVIVLIAVNIYSVSNQLPKQEYWDAIDYALLDQNTIQTNWSIGYLAWFKGGFSESYGSFFNQKEFKEGTVVNNKIECSEDLQAFKIKSFNDEMYVYVCKLKLFSLIY